MTWTRLVAMVTEFLACYPGHAEAEHGATTGVRLALDLTAVVLDDRARDREADTHSQRLGGDEGLKELRGNLRRDARSAIGNRYFDKTGTLRSCYDHQFAPIRPIHRFNRISDQIEQDLLDLYSVHQHRVVGCVAMECDPNSMLLR